MSPRLRPVLALVAAVAMCAAAVAAGMPAGAADARAVVAAHPAEPSRPQPAPAGTVRVVAADAEVTRVQASAVVAAMSAREKAASVVMGHIPTTDAATLRAFMDATGIGGFILMGANIPASEESLRALTAALTVDPALPPLISIDQEGGDVSRLPWDVFAGAATLKYDLPAASGSAFAGRAALVQRSGIGVNFGVVADVTDDRSMFIYRRALGTSPGEGAARVAAAVNAEGAETLSTLKHFPGHGAVSGDSHDRIPQTGMAMDQWLATAALPFEAGIDAGAQLLMFGHLEYSAIDTAPASLSAPWHRIAREELGFAGVSITDDLGMLQATGITAYSDPAANAVAALVAGNDMVLTIAFTDAESAPRIVDGIVAAVDSGALSAARLDEAATRVVALRLEVAAAGRGLMPCGECAAVG